MGNLESSFQENNFIFLMVIGILVMLAFALAFVVFVIFSHKKILQEQMTNQQQALEHQMNLVQSNILTQEEERKRIARELHDEIGSKLNVVLLNTYRLRALKTENTAINAITNEVDALINTTIDTTRRISHDLLPPTLEEFGLVEAIKELRDNYQQSGSIRIQLDLMGEEKKIGDKLVELNLFRVIQELISNSIRHGQAQQINIRLWIKKPSIQLIYEDDGKGFEQSGSDNKKGLGMKNLESRLLMIQASHQLESSPGKGVKVTINI